MVIKKVLVKVLMLGLVSTSIITSLIASDDSNNKRILTLERAIEAGYNMEERTAVFSKQIQAYNEKLKYPDSLISDIEYNTTRYSRDDILQQKKFLKDIVAYNVTVLYDAIIMLQKQIELDESNIKIIEKDLKQAEIKHKNGQLSQFELNQSRARLEEIQSKQRQNLLTLTDYKSQFLNLTNININNYDELEEDLSNKPLEYKNGINALITINVDNYMRNAEQLLNYKKNNILDIAQATTITGPSVSDLYSVEASVAESEYTLEQKKKNMIEGLRTCAVEMDNLQEQIVTQAVNIELEKDKLNILKIKYDKGYISELEISKAEQAIRELELARERNIYIYQQKKIVIEKPWVRY